jgi:hypothetical protein
MISARACGMPALAVPGDQAWDSAWALGFEDRDVTIVMDADRAGRLAAQRIQRDLTDVARTVTIADLAPDRQDGCDPPAGGPGRTPSARCGRRSPAGRSGAA